MTFNVYKNKEPDGDLRATPVEIFKQIQIVLNIKFDFDVCALRETSKCGARYFGPDRKTKKYQNALVLDWFQAIGKMKVVFMNPPYSDPMPWCRKAAEESQKGLVVVGLLPDDRSSEWYQQAIEGNASAIFIPRKRISFVNYKTGKPQTGNPKGSVIPIWTPWKTHTPKEQRIKLR